jgi:glycosyltransferase involved in cell wall biosynthesis
MTRMVMFLNASFPPDIRVEKEAQALQGKFEVSVVCAKKVGELDYEEIDGLRVFRIDSPALDQKKQMAFWDAYASIRFVHPKFYKEGLRVATEIGADAIHIHDLPLARTGAKVAKKLGVPVVLDLHENYPEALKTWFKWRKNPVVRLKNALFFSYKRWLRYEKSAISEVDHVIAVVKEMKNRLVEIHNVMPESIEVISNLEPKTFVTENVLDSELMNCYKGKFVISYIGGLGPHRGLDVMIEGTKYLKGKIDNLLILVVGSGSAAVIDNLKRISAENDLQDVVQFAGHQPKSSVCTYMSLSSINVVPHHSTTHTDNTVPHKLFQIMMTKKPLLVSSSRPLKRVVEETSSGLVFEAGNPQDFADKVMELYNDPSLGDRLGNNGYQETMNGSLNWEVEASKLNLFYQNVVLNTKKTVKH